MNPVVLSGKVAVVTGGGRGIGRATCEALAREGVRVVVADLDGAAAAAVATGIGKNAISRSLDVSNREQFRSVLDAAEQHFGPLDILVNNAGIMPVGYFVDETDEMTDRLVDVNYRGTLIGMKEAIKRMKPRGTGHIVNLASTGGWLPAPGVATYVGTKHAIVGLTDSVRLELTGSGINLSSVGPGIVKTELAAGLQEMRGMRGVTPEEVADAIIDGLKRKRHAIFSPGVVGIAAHVYGALPYTLRSLLFRVTKIDRLGPQIDQGTRKEYEARVVASIASSATDAESSQPGV
ncbi:SDR family NAD(P)-dependent oxidoreductase [Rhodococcus sp. USK13]|uniref:SDR family NAD(P)-dependent oxidoreductase n=1 Tax=Rhodococcus sp. USK13 TaxID=2806442 RepID=UPI001BCC4FC4|nr:SDR family NAD(P)-dependent oxidoreductase [Rhodococcus sp. USK13]